MCTRPIRSSQVSGMSFSRDQRDPTIHMTEWETPVTDIPSRERVAVLIVRSISRRAPRREEDRESRLRRHEGRRRSGLLLGGEELRAADEDGEPLHGWRLPCN